MYGNPEGIRALARHVGEAADRTRAEAGRGGRAEEVRWQSLGAGRYRAQLTEAVQAARASAVQLDDLAAALEAHARAVAHRLQQIADAEQWLRRQADNAVDEAHGLLSDLEHEGDRLMDGARSAAHAVTGVPGGDLRWLELARERGFRL